jgi:hypothetical protein
MQPLGRAIASGRRGRLLGPAACLGVLLVLLLVLFRGWDAGALAQESIVLKRFREELPKKPPPIVVPPWNGAISTCGGGARLRTGCGF